MSFRELARGKCLEQSLALTRAPHATVAVSTGENAQGSLSKFFLELLSALAMPAWAIRNKTESVQFCLFFFGGGSHSLLDRNPDVSSFIPPRTGPGQEGRSGRLGFRGKHQSWGDLWPQSATLLLCLAKAAPALQLGCPSPTWARHVSSGGMVPEASCTCRDFFAGSGSGPSDLCEGSSSSPLPRAWQSLG